MVWPRRATVARWTSATTPALMAAYKDWHRRVFPEVLGALRAIGVTRMKSFLRGTRMFMSMEAVDSFDPDRDWACYASMPRTTEWEDTMHGFQQRLADAAPGKYWIPLEPVFDLETA